jgi:hypothetical protein
VAESVLLKTPTAGCESVVPITSDAAPPAERSIDDEKGCSTRGADRGADMQGVRAERLRGAPLIAMMETTDFGDGGLLRHARFLHLRDDKLGTEVIRER